MGSGVPVGSVAEPSSVPAISRSSGAVALFPAESTTRGGPVTAPSGTVTSTTRFDTLSGSALTRRSESELNFTNSTRPRPFPDSSTTEPTAAAPPSHCDAHFASSILGSPARASALDDQASPAPKLAAATIAPTNNSLGE